jgi:hypothetical protein
MLKPAKQTPLTPCGISVWRVIDLFHSEHTDTLIGNRRMLCVRPPGLLCGVIAALLLSACPGGLRAQDSPRDATPPSQTDNAGTTAEPADIPVPLPRGKRLILTDGTFQIVREYECQGDRVRYYSLEESAWEEMPATLVDWDATQKAEADLASQQKAVVDKLRAITAAENTAGMDSDRSLEVTAGVILPDPAGFYALDGQQVVTMEQSQAVSRLDKSRAIAKAISGVPFISTKRQIEVPGKRAKIRVHTAEPEFYFRTADGRAPQIALLRIEAKGDLRQVATANTNLVGETKYDDQEIPLTMWDAARGVQRYTVEQKLGPGEYAFVETTAEGVNLWVWDFGVDAAPAGAGKSSAPNPPAAGQKAP